MPPGATDTALPPRPPFRDRGWSYWLVLAYIQFMRSKLNGVRRDVIGADALVRRLPTRTVMAPAELPATAEIGAAADRLNPAVGGRPLARVRSAAVARAGAR